MTMHKHGGAGFWKMDIKSRWGTTIEPKRTADTMTLFQGMLDRIKGISSNFQEGKLYELVKSYKANDITLFEDEYKNKGMPQPLSYQRGE